MNVADGSAESFDLTESERRALLGFLGFGNPQAPFVFVGMEEGLTETPDYPLLAQLKDRARLPSIVDIRASEVHPEKYLTGSRPPIQRTWSPLICVVLACSGDASPSNDTIRAYQRDKLGSASGDSLLLELLPLPSRKIANWAPYNRYFPDFPDRETYRNALTRRRTAAIRERLAYGPRLVVLYGSAYWPEYRSIFPAAAKWSTQGVFEYARHGPTAVLLMPHPVSRQMNGNRAALCELARNLVAFAGANG